MAESKAVNQINFDYNGKHYCLEYTRDSVKKMEAAGYNPSESGTKPLIEVEQLWAGAFLANPRNVSNRVIEKLFDEMDDKSKLLDTLRNMIAETYYSLVDMDDESHEGKVKWTATL